MQKSASSRLCWKIWPGSMTWSSSTSVIYSSIITHTIGIQTSSHSVRTFVIYYIPCGSPVLPTGAYASFGPGQFGQMYAEVTQPAAEFLLYFCGEATSTNHA